MERKTIRVTRSHGLEEEVLLERGEKLVASLCDEYVLTLGYDERNERVTFTCDKGIARGVTGWLRIGNPIDIELDLPPFVASLSKSIEEEINEILDKEIDGRGSDG